MVSLYHLADPPETKPGSLMSHRRESASDGLSTRPFLFKNRLCGGSRNRPG